MPKQRSERASKLSVSLFPADYERMNQIIAFMLKQGVRVNASMALRLALRTARIDAGLLMVLKQVEAEDGRRK